jgi:hypothetical protein
MALARFQRTIVDASGNVVASPTITVRDQVTNALISLFSDRDGLTAIANPFTGTTAGLAAFHAAGGAYKITATSGAFSISWDWVGIGTAQEIDIEDVNDLIDTAVADAFPDPLPVNKGGTGLQTLTANNVMLGNGTSNVLFVAPSTSGNALISNGTTWASTTVPAPAALSTASGSAPSYSARAWVNFNGTGTVAIRASGNVSSITDNGIGSYAVNLTTSLPDTDYAINVSIDQSLTGYSKPQNGTASFDRAVGSFKVCTGTINELVTALGDFTSVYISVFR